MSLRTVTSKPFTMITVLVLALLALGHVLRLAFALEVVVGGMTVPLVASIPVAIIAAGLALMVWRECRG